jgi:N6-adenosine-specific RNA methylase IME4
LTLTRLPRAHYAAIYADPPWRFRTWNNATAVKARSNTPECHGSYTSSAVHYQTMPIEEIEALPIGEIAADDCALFIWMTWPLLLDALRVIHAWGFEYKTCAFSWTKAHGNQIEMFQDELNGHMGLGYWTRANNEACLLATRGNPKRLNAAVRQAIIEPRRQHSRKPNCVYERIEQLVAGPYLELFARTRREGWEAWGNELEKFGEMI